MDELVLFKQAGLEFILRWFHYVAGVAWIGLLYYFNFVQVPFFAETDANVRSGAIAKLVPRALWWFRWSAMVTFLTGLVILLWNLHRVLSVPGHQPLLAWSWAVAILVGGLLGTIMFLNVWLIIWPKQKIVIASTIAVAAGGAADPNAAAAGARAFLASRTNALFSIPMLFFMGAATHLGVIGDERPAVIPFAIIVLIIAIFEANVLFGTKAKGLSKILEKHVAVIHVGIALALVFYLLLALLTT